MKYCRVVIGKDESEVAISFCEYFAEIVNSRIERIGFSAVAISGGRTPDEIFRKLSVEYRSQVNWPGVLVFWVDERCVPPDVAESNYGRAKSLLLDNVEIPPDNIFRIRGESDPVKESVDYAELLRANLTVKNDLPCFDLVMLGVGEDGHTASIFPGQESLFETDEPVAVTKDPRGENRITVTGKVINNARNIAVVAVGKNKLHVITDVFSSEKGKLKYPIELVSPVHGELTWFVTSDAFPSEDQLASR